MKDLNKKFEDEWKKAFENAEEEPSALLWQGIENKLSEKELAVYKKKNFYLKVAAAVLFILFSSTSIYYFYPSKNTNLIATESLKNNQSENNAVLSAPSSDVGNNERSLSSTTTLPGIGREAEGNTTTSLESKDLITNKNTSAVPTESFASTHETVENQNPVISSAPKSTITGEIIRGSKHNEELRSHLASISNQNRTIPVADETGANEALFGHQKTTKLDPLTPIALNSSKIEFKRTWITVRTPLEDVLNTDYASIKDTKNKARWYAGYDFTPTYTNQNFVKTSQPVSPHNLDGPFLSLSRHSKIDEFNTAGTAKELESAITPEFSYNSGLKGGVQVNKRLKIEAGLNYVYTQSKVLTNFYVTDHNSNDQYPAFNVLLQEDQNSSKTIAAFNTPEIISKEVAHAPTMDQNKNKTLDSKDAYKTAKIYTQYIGVPLTLNYQLIDKKINVYLGGGVSADFFLQYGSKKKEGFEKETINSGETSSFKPVGFSVLIAPEIEYSFTSKYSFYLRPVYKGALTSYTDTQKITNKPSSTGVGFGLRYNLN